MSLNILFKDATLQVVEKPAGLDIEGLKELLPAGFFPAHRLDKDTSGVLLIATSEESLEYLQEQFQKREVQKTYLCLVEGTLKEKQGNIETLLGRSPNDRRKQKVFLPGEPKSEEKREATTEYQVLKEYEGYSFLKVHPRTGRKHQIRVHLSHLGHPIAGDKLYGFKSQRVPARLSRQFLHAHSLTLTLMDGTKKTFTSPLPKDLQEVLDNLKEL
jgi:23S rRNA pseudouridine1911/1915/1917 synthase